MADMIGLNVQFHYIYSIKMCTSTFMLGHSTPLWLLSHFHNLNDLSWLQLQYAGREVLGTTAVGVGQRHKSEVQELLNQTFSH